MTLGHGAALFSGTCTICVSWLGNVESSAGISMPD
jgi:hypothetical protein